MSSKTLSECSERAPHHCGRRCQSVLLFGVCLETAFKRLRSRSALFLTPHSEFKRIQRHQAELTFVNFGECLVPLEGADRVCSYHLGVSQGIDLLQTVLQGR